MKKIVMTSLLNLVVTGSVFAADVNVPFFHKAVPTEGLTISYNTYSTEKVVCTTENFYKGFLSITNNGVLSDAGIAYSDYDNQQFYFTSTGNNKDMGDIQQFHVDPRGVIKIADTHYKPHESFATCFYVTESVK